MKHILRICRVTAALLLSLAAECVATAESAASGSFSREAMLGDIVRNSIVPAYQQLAFRCRELTNAVGELAKAPGQGTMDDARNAWVAASLAASRVRCVQVGPLAAPGGVGSVFYFWQQMPNNIERQIASTRSIDASLLEEMGATTKGMFALEYLLYGSKGGPNAPPGKVVPPLELISDPIAQRRRDYMMLVARDVEAKAGELEKAWSDTGSQGVAAKFAAGGQQSLNQLVNVIASALEDLSDRHLHLALVLPNPVTAQVYRIERSPSGTSVESAVAILESAQKIYRNSNGLSLIDAVKQINMPTATALEQRFADALKSTRAIGAPLEEAIVKSRPTVEEAFDKTHTLEVKFKVDLASTLGVTLTFSSADGD